MKLKITSFHLIVIVIIQVILINTLLAVFFIKQSSLRKSDLAGIKSVSADKNQVLHNGPPKQGSSTDIESGLTSLRPYFGAGEKKDGLIELIEKTKLPSSALKVYKILDEPGDMMEFTATAYDLSYESCAKYPSHPAYGITFSGKKAVKGRTIAVDPEVIALGSIVYIKFPGDYSFFDGLYTAEDTGSKIKGNIIDIFLGESAFWEMEKFGSMRVYVRVVSSAEKKALNGK